MTPEHTTVVACGTLDAHGDVLADAERLVMRYSRSPPTDPVIVVTSVHVLAGWAFPWDQAPRYLIHDRDHAFDRLQATAKAMGIEEVVTAPRALARSIRRAICGFRPS
jgi:hypothetical protein